jgi:hypothetical protein
MTRGLRVRPILFLVAVTFAGVALLGVSTPLSLRAQSSYEAAAPWNAPVTDVDWSDEIPAHLSVVEGQVTLENDGRAEEAEENVALLAGDRLRTERGRVEVLFADGSAIAVDEFTDLEFLSDSLLRLDRGRLRISIARASSALDYRVDAVGTSTWIRSAGEYRITVMPDRGMLEPEVRVSVMRGSAEVSSERGRTLVMAGYEAVATADSLPSRPYAVTAASWDPFDRWADAQRDYRTGYRSAQYLPADIRYYSGVFDRHGAWEYHQPYGYVWYPRVAAEWRPYYDGRWSVVGNFGWFWVGAGRWTWPTHHYGRWGWNSGRWYWVPDRRWAPAWVSWASAPGYVSWCPLGWDNRPIFALSITNYNTWRGWTVLPSRHFVRNVRVTTHALRDRGFAFPRDTRFVTHNTAPVRPVTAARAVAPLRAPGSHARAASYAQPRAGRALDATGGTITAPGQRADRSRVVAPRAAPERGVAPERGSSPNRATAPGRAAAAASPRVRTPSSAPVGAGDTEATDAPPRARSRVVAPAGSPTPRLGPSPRTRVAPAPVPDTGSVDRGATSNPAAGGRVASPRARTAPAPGGEPGAREPAPGVMRRAPSRAPAERPAPAASPESPRTSAPGRARSSAGAPAPAAGSDRGSRVERGGGTSGSNAGGGSGGGEARGRARPR